MIRLLILISGVALVSSAFPFRVPDLLSRNYFPWRRGTCNVQNHIEDFNPEKFFTGHWYEVSSYGNYLFQANSICSTVQTEIRGDEVRYLFYQYEPLLKKYAYLRGLTDLPHSEGANFNVQFDFLAGLTSIEVPYQILATDYDNLAVFYSCKEAFGFKAEMAWLATRTRGEHGNDEELREIVKKAGLNYDEFIGQKSTDCGEKEPYL